MEKDLDDCEFWLPPQFLTDDDLLMDFKSTHSVGQGKNGNSLFGGGDFTYGFNNPFGSNSDLSSPVESVVGSTETESDEDDYITRKMARSTLQENTKGLSLSRSPQSTLCGVLGAGCGCKQGSSRGSPNCPSQASSPPPMNRPDVSLDLLYAAAGEVARIRMMEESAAGLYHNKGGGGGGGGGIWSALPPRKTTSPVPVGPKTPKPNLGHYSTNQGQLSYQQLQVAQFQRLKQQQMIKQGGFRQFPLNQSHQQMTENRARNGALNLPNSAWPTLQQSQQQQQQPQANPGSGMRAVFLGNPGGPKRECAGTGVFLPRRVGTQTETRKKPGCPVILPDRVVQALNLNLEAMDVAATRPQSQVQTRCHNENISFTSATDGGLKYRNNMAAAAAQQRRNSRTQPLQPVAMPQELQLPQEWTY